MEAFIDEIDEVLLNMGAEYVKKEQGKHTNLVRSEPTSPDNPKTDILDTLNGKKKGGRESKDKNPEDLYPSHRGQRNRKQRDLHNEEIAVNNPPKKRGGGGRKNSNRKAGNYTQGARGSETSKE